MRVEVMSSLAGRRWRYRPRSTQLAMVAAAIISAAVLSGCSNSAGPGEDVADPDRSTKQGVIDVIENAYNAKDAEQYLKCLADEMEFWLDPDGHPGGPDCWGRSEEQTIHEAAFGTRTSVESVTLTLVQESPPVEIPGPNPEDPVQWEYLQDYSLSVVIDGAVHEAEGLARFRLATHPADTTAQGDQLWSVSKWEDIGGATARSDAATWTDIKILFAECTGNYPLRTSRANTVEKLRQAYAEMDTTAFADCLADEFEFWLNPEDLNNPGNPLPSYWGFTEETAIAETMFGPGTDIISVQLTLTQIGDPVQIAPPNPGDEPHWQHVYSVDLYVHLPNELTLWAHDASRFTLAVDPDEVGPSGETLWEIVKWEDIDAPTGRVENTSWGGIKALYR